MKKMILVIFSICFSMLIKAQVYQQNQEVVTDIDGNEYHTITIGTQVWMVENLKTTRYNDGEIIPNVTGTEWYGLTSGAFCWYFNDISYKNTYGALYNWYAVNTYKLCPSGWHIPSKEEWDTMLLYIDPNAIIYPKDGKQSANAGGALKEAGLTHWSSPNTGATNISGFTGLPGGWRDEEGGFSSLGDFGVFYTVESEGRLIHYNDGGLFIQSHPKQYGYSVRCIKDAPGFSYKKPTVSTFFVTSISETKANCGGSVTSDGGAPITSRGICWSTTPYPTIADNKTSNGTGLGNFSSTLAELTGNTTYYVRAYATNVAGAGYGNQEVFTATTPQNITVTDIDGNVYHTVAIGPQIWMVENLKTTKYNDGTAIPIVPDNTEWANLTSPGYCWYNNDALANKNTYGALYNWYAVNTDKLCPVGWHIPNDADWTILTNGLGGESIAGGKLREAGTSHWYDTGTWATNETGYTALPGGNRYNGLFGSQRDYFMAWSSIENSQTSASWWYIYCSGRQLLKDARLKQTGLSVRCIKDSPSDIPKVSTSSVTSISQSSATCGGIIAQYGAPDITKRGVCWSTSANPIIMNSKTDDGIGSGSFISIISGLAAGTTYYIRAYASNTIATYYGPEVTFTTKVEPHFNPVWTGNGIDHMNINIYSARLDGIDLEVEDEIGVFDGSICVGKGTLTGIISQLNTLNIVVSRNDGSGNGYTVGNPITYKLYDYSKSLEITNTTAMYSFADPSWSTDGKFAIDATAFAELNSSTKLKHDIALNTGWNIISSNVVPTNLDMKALFQPLIDGGNLKKVMDEAGKTIENFGVFGGWKNNIGNLNSTKGYKVNVTIATTLSVEGTPVPLPLDIPLNTGWNIISYPVTNTQDAMTAFQPLITAGKLKKVMDETGKAIENFGVFGGWKNNIGSLSTGKGYKVNVTGTATLTFTESGTKAATVTPELLASTHFKPVFSGNGTDHMNINLIDLNQSHMLPGDELGIFDGSLCVGSATIGIDQALRDYISIPVSANDGLSETANGFTEGHSVILKLYRNAKEQLLFPELVNNSISTFTKGESILARVTNLQTTGNDITADSKELNMICYPNPFSKEITIEVQNVGLEEVTVEIYNINGQKIKMLYKGTIDQPIVLKWNGKSDNGQQVPPGVYLCKVNGIAKQIIYSTDYIY